MKFKITFSFSSSNKTRGDNEALAVSDTSEAVELLNDLQGEDDVIYVHIEDNGSRVQIYPVDDLIFFQLYMTNGMYENHLPRFKVVSMLEELESVWHNPTGFDLLPASI